MTPDLPLPTDNYYKFCALAGVAVSLVSLYLPGTIAIQLDKNIFELRSEIAVAEIETAYLKDLTEENSRVRANTLAGKTAEQVRVEGKLPVSITPEQFSAELDALIRARRDLQISLAKTEIKVQQTERLMNYLIVAGAAGLLGLTIGIGMAIYGFRNWYHKIQLPLDRKNATRRLRRANDAQQGVPADRPRPAGEAGG